MTVPPGKYFMMGDSRDNSFDSRYFGFVERKQIVGRSNRVLLSFDKNHSYLPRVSRFFSLLDK
jgi:signal peptidase I